MLGGFMTPCPVNSPINAISIYWKIYWAEGIVNSVNIYIFFFNRIRVVLLHNRLRRLSTFILFLFVDKNESLNSFVKAIIENGNSCTFLEPILKLPIVLIEKDNPSVQLMVQTRLQQLENVSHFTSLLRKLCTSCVNGPLCGPLSCVGLFTSVAFG